tara:strand:- start:418 stop:1281 length:864 start_codon:yes stop_codon:yes gene_type:complete
MAEKRRIKARAVSNVAASKTALIDLPVGPRYHEVTLEHGYSAGTNTVAAAASNITEIRVLVNGRIQRVFSGTQLRDLNILNGTTYDCQGVPNTSPGVSFPIYFAEPWRKDARDQDALAWVTKGFKSFQIEVDISSASTPTLVASCAVDDFQPSVEPSYVTMRRQGVAASGTSFDINSIDKKGLLQQVSLYPDSGGSQAATIVTVRKDGDIIHELTKSSNFALLTNNGMAPTASGRTASIYDLVFDHDDLLNSSVMLQGVKEFTLTVEAASAMSGTLTFIVQRYGPLE